MKGRAHLAVRFTSLTREGDAERYRIETANLSRTAASTKKKDAAKKSEGKKSSDGGKKSDQRTDEREGPVPVAVECTPTGVFAIADGEAGPPIPKPYRGADPAPG